jgi:hypothetical protein
MPGGKSSGITLTNRDASIVLGMVGRDDRDHDMTSRPGSASTKGRIAEVKAGSHGAAVTAAAVADLPPKGSPGVKGRRLYASLSRARALLDEKGASGLEEAKKLLADAQARFDANEG